MSLLSYTKLVELVNQGVINANPENINGASIDITLGDTIMVEPIGSLGRVVGLKAKEHLRMKTMKIPGDGYTMLPGEFLLASSQELFNLPATIASEYKLKSSLARSGLQHLLAGWCDPGWNNSRLTLEFKNVTNFHTLVLIPGMKIGQMVFWECEPVPADQSYAVKGQYNGQQNVTGNKGVR